MRWLLRLVFIRLLGRRAIPILALLGLIQAVRGSRSGAVARQTRESGRVRPRDGTRDR